jgi:hypothetical protein
MPPGLCGEGPDHGDDRVGDGTGGHSETLTRRPIPICLRRGDCDRTRQFTARATIPRRSPHGHHRALPKVVLRWPDDLDDGPGGHVSDFGSQTQGDRPAASQENRPRRQESRCQNEPRESSGAGVGDRHAQASGHRLVPAMTCQRSKPRLCCVISF